MSFSMSKASLPALEMGLNALSGVLDKGAAYAAAKKLDPTVLVQSRLAPDMFPLSRQVQIACDMAKNGSARLAGVDPPPFEDKETTLDELKARVAKTVAYVKSVDGKKIDFADTVTYRGMMFTGIPNMAWVFGYFRASWTLRADLVADFVCRLLKHMKEKGAKQVEVALRPEDHNMPVLSWIDPENFNPGYMMRNMHLLPKRGDKPEWQHSQDYWAEKDQIPAIDLDDKAFVYS